MTRWLLTSLAGLTMFGGCFSNMGCASLLTPMNQLKQDTTDLNPAGPGILGRTAGTITGLVDRDAKLTNLAASVDGEAIEPGRRYFWGTEHYWGSNYTGLSGRVALDTKGTGGRLQDDLRAKCIDILEDKNSDDAMKLQCLNMLHDSDKEHADGTAGGD